VDTTIVPNLGSDGKPFQYVAIRTDVTERKRAEEALQRSEQQWHDLMDHAADAIFVSDHEGRHYLEVNRAACEMLGYTHEEFLGMGIGDLLHPEDIKCEPVKFSEMYAGHTIHTLRRHRHKDGRYIPVELSARMLPDGRLQAVVRDITERKRAEERIQQFAFYDVLTGLPNRRLLMDRLHQALAVSARSEQHGAVMFLDMDHFKTLNDTKGHDVGDMLLIEVAKRLQDCVRDVDTVARLGGDEFVVLLEALSSEEIEAATAAGLVMEKIRTALSQPYQFHEYEYCTTASIGVSMFCGNQQSVNDLLKCADQAMYSAKMAGREAIRR
jgi:diguanylate cyclase (GGDEF)-like protein/PAS domain S-box-containing protein